MDGFHFGVEAGTPGKEKKTEKIWKKGRVLCLVVLWEISSGASRFFCDKITKGRKMECVKLIQGYEDLT